MTCVYKASGEISCSCAKAARMQMCVNACVNGIVHPKMKILSLITRRHVVSNLQDICSSSEDKWRYFWWNV